jgi:preprotein translocase subunit SecA
LGKLDEIANRQKWEVPCKAVLASSLNANLAASLNMDHSATIDILVGERHPLPSVDDHLQDFADELPSRCRFSHHVSLEDAVIKVFAGDWVKNVLKQLGVADDEAIESQMVSRRIRSAQQKIESRNLAIMNTQSAAEWLEKNCPDLVPK